MKKLPVLLIAIGGLLSGCIPVFVGEPHGGDGRGHDGMSNRASHDRDGDGVSNRHDRRPDDPRRY